MSRRKIAKKRSVKPDPLYNNYIVSMMIVRIIKHGKKSLAQRIMYQTLEIIKNRCSSDPINILEKAVRNATPIVEIKARRVGGSTYQVPLEVRASRGTNLAIRWITKFSRAKTGKTIAVKLANEIINTANNTGNSVRKKDETHKMAEANKAFAYYRH